MRTLHVTGTKPQCRRVGVIFTSTAILAPSLSRAARVRPAASRPANAPLVNARNALESCLRRWSRCRRVCARQTVVPGTASRHTSPCVPTWWKRSEEHTSELQSLAYLVCRLLLEKKKKKKQLQ